MRRVALLLLLLAGPLWAGDVKITGTLAVPSNSFVALEATGIDPEAMAVWDVVSAPAGWAETEFNVLEVGGKYVFTGPDGTYTVKLRVLKKGVPAQTVRATPVIGRVSPPLPPLPPVPPTPDPSTDPLTPIVAAVFAGDAPPDPAARKAAAAKIAAAYRAEAAAARSSAAQTYGDFYADVQKVITSVPADLPAVRAVLKGEMHKLWPPPLPVPTAPITAAQKLATAALFDRFALLAEGVSK